MKDQNNIPRRVVRIVLTGGIAAGKSRMLEYLRTAFAGGPIPAAFVKECATEKIAAGFTPDRYGITAFQHAVFRRQLVNENHAFRRMLPEAKKTGLPVLLVCDRGLGDCGAYLPEETFATICRSMDYNRRRLLGRYQGVLFLDSVSTLPEIPFDAADGNANRLESGREEAVLLNGRTLQAWSDHPNLTRIPAEADFARKMEKVSAALETMLTPWYGEAAKELLRAVK